MAYHPENQINGKAMDVSAEAVVMMHDITSTIDDRRGITRKITGTSRLFPNLPEFPVRERLAKLG
jgi:hypothetical protein